MLKTLSALYESFKFLSSLIRPAIEKLQAQDCQLGLRSPIVANSLESEQNLAEHLTKDFDRNFHLSHAA